MMKTHKLSSYILTLFLFTLQSVVFSQQSNNVSGVKPESGTENEELKFEISFFQSSNLSRVILAYRNYGTSEYKMKEMVFSGSKAVISLPPQEVLPPTIEYYFILESTSGNMDSYPAGCPGTSTPLLARIATREKPDEELFFLSPEEGVDISAQDFFVSVSLIKLPEFVSKNSSRLYIDNKDITARCIITEDMIYYSDPATQLSEGLHNIRVEVFDSTGKLYKKISSGIISSGTTVPTSAGAILNRISLNGESRNEEISGVSEWYNNLNFQSETSYKSWELKTDILLTSDEKKYYQPNNRYSISIENDWLKISAGDSYPDFPSLILNGKRVRGIYGSINKGYFSIQTAYGEISRAVEGKILELYPAGYQSGSSAVISIDSAKYGQPQGLVNYGIYKRTLFAVRPSFHLGNVFSFGLSYLHSADKKESIEFGTHPKENVVFGSDIRLSLDEQRIQFETQAAISLQNYDISGGTLTDAQIDSIFTENNNYDISAGDIKDIKNLLGGLITVNEHMAPLNPLELPTLAAESGLSFNYFGNYFKASYVYRGNDFQSFGQSYTRTDIAGFSFTDRLRLIENKLFISLNYEDMRDNLQNTKPADTHFKVFNGSASIFPGSEYPNVMLAYTLYDNSNGINTSDSISIKNKTNRFTLQMSYDFLYRIQHKTSLSFSTSSRDDFSYRNADVTNTSVMLSLNSYWTNAITSSFSVSINNARVHYAATYNYTSITGGCNYEIMQDKLLLTSLLNLSFGNLKRQVLDISGEYSVLENLKLQLSLRYLNYADSSSDRIVSFMTRYEL